MGKTSYAIKETFVGHIEYYVNYKYLILLKQQWKGFAQHFLLFDQSDDLLQNKIKFKLVKCRQRYTDIFRTGISNTQKINVEPLVRYDSSLD